MGASQGLSLPLRGPSAGTIPRPPTILEPNGFGVHYSKLGVLIYAGGGGISLDWYPELMKFCGSRIRGQHKVLHSGIAWTCNAHTAITTRKGAEAWMASMGIGPNQPDWLKSCDIGTSALTIYATLASAPHVLRGQRPAPPVDADDFGRCYRLVTKWRPEFRGDLHIVADIHKGPWEQIVARWDEFGALLEARNDEVLTARLREINDARSP